MATEKCSTMKISRRQSFPILKGLYRHELNFIADKLSHNRKRWSYDKRSKSSVKKAITRNVKEEDLGQLLAKSWGKEMPDGETFPKALQFKKMVFGPLGSQKSVSERSRYDGEIVVDILTKYVKGENLIEKLVKEAQDKIPQRLMESVGKEDVSKESALLQLVLAYLSDKKICDIVNELLTREEVKMNVSGLYENVEFYWVVTRYGLALVPEEEPINNLANLLKRNYKEEDLIPELRAYSGDFTTKLLGYCIIERPDRILRRMFGLPGLRRIAKKFGFVSGRIDIADELIPLVLLGLGFDVPPPLIGMAEYFGNVQKHKRGLLESRDVGRKSGIMSQVFVEMERILRDLAHFYIAFVWDEQLEDLESEVEEDMPELTSRQVKMKALDILLQKKFRIRKSFERLGFGDFIGLIRTANKMFEKNRSCKKKMTSSFGRSHILKRKEIKMLDSISPYRSSFTHTKDYPGDEKCDEIVRSVENLIEEIRTRKIYPLVVRVSRSVSDEYGKSYAECIEENGDPWLIYTDEDLDTSRPYFVHSKTPNIAVNPVIVEKIF